MKNAAVWTLAVASIGSVIGLALAADEPTGPVLFGPEQVARWKASTQSVTVEQTDGKLGKAVKFTFAESKTAAFATAYAKTPAEADECAGLSFWVKGDGSDNFGCLQLVDSTYAKRHDYAFPLKSTEWTKITVPWCDFMPVIGGPVLDPKNGFKPSGVEAYWFGKRQYWPWPPPANSFTMDTLALEKKIDVDATDYTPKGDPLERLRAKLKDKKPVTFVSMGDSLTDKKHNSNSPATVKTWAEQLADKIKEKYGSEVKYVNPALGGRTLGQCSVLIPTWLKDNPQPDLVAVFFGGNDYGIFKDQKTSDEDMGKFFGQWQAQNVDRIRRLTKGSADIILMTTAPGFKAWDTYKPLIEATKAVAKDKKTALCDIDAAFHTAGTAEDALKAKYWHWDNVHMGPKGHEAICEAMMKLIEGK